VVTNSPPWLPSCNRSSLMSTLPWNRCRTYAEWNATKTHTIKTCCPYWNAWRLSSQVHWAPSSMLCRPWASQPQRRRLWSTALRQSQESPTLSTSYSLVHWLSHRRKTKKLGQVLRKRGMGYSPTNRSTWVLVDPTPGMWARRLCILGRASSCLTWTRQGSSTLWF